MQEKRYPGGSDKRYGPGTAIRGHSPAVAPVGRGRTPQLKASTAFPKYRTYGLGGEIDLVVPSMDDRIAVEVIDEFDDALFQFVF